MEMKEQKLWFLFVPQPLLIYLQSSKVWWLFALLGVQGQGADGEERKRYGLTF